MHSIAYSREALAVLTKMPRNTRELIKAKVSVLAVDPSKAQNVKRLVGRPGYRLRVGDWRVIYDLDSGRLIVRVMQIGSRGGVY